MTKTKKVLEPLGDNLLIKGIKKKSLIELADGTSKTVIESLIIHRKGKDCEWLEPGDEVVIPESIMFIVTPKGVRPNPDVFIGNKLEDPDNEFLWLVIREKDVQFIIKS